MSRGVCLYSLPAVKSLSSHCVSLTVFVRQLPVLLDGNESLFSFRRASSTSVDSVAMWAYGTGWLSISSFSCWCTELHCVVMPRSVMHSPIYYDQSVVFELAVSRRNISIFFTTARLSTPARCEHLVSSNHAPRGVVGKQLKLDLYWVLSCLLTLGRNLKRLFTQEPVWMEDDFPQDVKKSTLTNACYMITQDLAHLRQKI